MRDYLAPVLAAIQTPPHMPYQFLEAYKAKFRRLEYFIAFLKDKRAIEKEVEEVTGHWWRYPVDYLPSEMREVINSVGQEETYFYSEPMSKRIQDIQDYSKSELSTDTLTKAIQRMIRLETDRSEYQEFNKHYISFIKEYPEALEYLHKQADPEESDYNRKVSHDFQMIRTALDAVYKYIDLYLKFAVRINALLVRRQMTEKSYYSGTSDRKQRPPAKEFEILFHATTNVSAILKEGFKTRSELGEEKAALGGGPSDVVSFTADIEIAKAIVDGIRDLVKVANGEMTFEDVEKLAQEEGLDPDIFDRVKQDYAPRERPPGYPDFVYTDDKYRTPKNLAFEAYRMALLPYSKLRYNPTFFGVRVENFENIKPENIGIVAAKVQMDQVTEYLQSMEEFRVPVSAILSVKRVLY